MLCQTIASILLAEKCITHLLTVSKFGSHHIIESSSEIRRDILNGGEEWRKAVSNPVEDAIDENYDEIVSVLEPEGEYSGSKYKDAIASN